MTDIKKTKKGKAGPQTKKLQLKKQTLKDLSAGRTGQVKGGARKGASDACQTYECR